jgi:hypothetical protein
MNKPVTNLEVVLQEWREQWPINCPVKLKDGNGRSVGACWHGLKNGVCPSHGKIYESKVEEMDFAKNKFFAKLIERCKGENSFKETNSA